MRRRRGEGEVSGKMREINLGLEDVREEGKGGVERDEKKDGETSVEVEESKRVSG